MKYNKKIKFLEIIFDDIHHKDIKLILKSNGLFVFPAAEPLANFKINSPYHKSLIYSDYVFFDSGYFVLLLKIIKGISVKKFSGYKFLKIFLKFLKKKNNKVLLVDPSIKISKNNIRFFKNLGINKVKSYIAPFYKKNPIIDTMLIRNINKFRPDNIIINLGGGVQEVLGFYVKSNIKYKPKIICTGGAISYFTGDQAPISSFIDKYYLGWFFRILFKPKVFIPRYLGAILLSIRVFKNKVEIVK